jgi:hypothetical protein
MAITKINPPARFALIGRQLAITSSKLRTAPGSFPVFQTKSITVLSARRNRQLFSDSEKCQFRDPDRVRSQSYQRNDFDLAQVRNTELLHPDHAQDKLQNDMTIRMTLISREFVTSNTR